MLNTFVYMKPKSLHSCSKKSGVHVTSAAVNWRHGTIFWKSCSYMDAFYTCISAEKFQAFLKRYHEKNHLINLQIKPLDKIGKLIVWKEWDIRALSGFWPSLGSIRFFQFHYTKLHKTDSCSKTELYNLPSLGISTLCHFQVMLNISYLFSCFCQLFFQGCYLGFIICWSQG